MMPLSGFLKNIYSQVQSITHAHGMRMSLCYVAVAIFHYLLVVCATHYVVVMVLCDRDVAINCVYHLKTIYQFTNTKSKYILYQHIVACHNGLQLNCG